MIKWPDESILQWPDGSMARSPDSYRRNLPPRDSAFMAMREEEVGAARRAIIRNQDILGFDARAFQLILRDGDEIEACGGKMLRRVARRIGALEEERVAISSRFGRIGQLPEKALGRGELSVERFHNFLAHLVTAGSNRRSQHGN